LLDPDAPPLPADVGVLACIMLATTHLYGGRLARARAFNREAVARADALGTPFHRTLANSLAAEVCMLLDDVPEAKSLAEEAIRLADEYDFSALRVTTTMTRGWCDVEEGRIARGLADLHGAFEEYGTTGQRYGLPSYTMLLARAYIASGDAASASDVVDGALRFADHTGGRVYEPELHRLKGECLLLSARPDEAVRSFEHAMAIAADRRALLFELRAATSCCRVGGAPAKARLAAVVDRFENADDSPNLRAARALLKAT
jgi:predicted ATPase